MMKGFRKYLWIAVAFDLLLMVSSIQYAIWGILYLIFAMLFAILEVLLKKGWTYHD